MTYLQGRTRLILKSKSKFKILNLVLTWNGHIFVILTFKIMQFVLEFYFILDPSALTLKIA